MQTEANHDTVKNTSTIRRKKPCGVSLFEGANKKHTSEKKRSRVGTVMQVRADCSCFRKPLARGWRAPEAAAGADVDGPPPAAAAHGTESPPLACTQARQPGERAAMFPALPASMSAMLHGGDSAGNKQSSETWRRKTPV